MDISKDDRNYYSIKDSFSLNGNYYELGDYIGRGGNGVVYECINQNGETFAIKFQLNFSEKSTKRFLQEIKILKTVKSPFIIGYIDDGCIKSIELKTGVEKSIFCLIMEKADKNLREYINDKGSISYSEYMSQFLGLCSALSELHQYAIHRDIKLENILIIGEKWVLSDLGLCSFLNGEHEDLTDIHEKIGPKYWMSPEAINRIYNSNDIIEKSSDVFQLSAVFWYVVNRKYPLGIVTIEDWKDPDDKLCDLVLRCLSNNKAKRPQDGSELLCEITAIRNQISHLFSPSEM